MSIKWSKELLVYMGGGGVEYPRYIILVSRKDQGAGTPYGIFGNKKRAEGEAHKLFRTWCEQAGVDHTTHIFPDGPWVDVLEVLSPNKLNEETIL